MKICKIQAEKKHRFCLVLEDGQTLPVTEQELAAFSLRPGRRLTPAQVEEIAASVHASEAKAQAARLIGSRPLSKAELYRKLLEKGQNEETAQTVVEQLEAAGAIDDAGYAAILGRHYAVRGYGPRRVEEELRRRGIDRSLWEEALREGPETGERAAQYLIKKLGQKGISENPKERGRVIDGLRRRGFSWSDVEDGIERYKDWLKQL